MKRKPKLTKRERQAASGGPKTAGAPKHQHNHQHIHCIACGKHLDEGDFEAPATATIITCDHGSQFPSCVQCMSRSMALVKEHDASGKPVQVAPAFH